jgi:very-short-patch-repair endonuclease
MSDAEETLALHIRAAKLPEPMREFKFHPARKWRFDFAWPARMLAEEVEGGIWTNGRHTRGKGYTDDCAKYNQATLLGWKVLRFPVSEIQSGEALKMIEEMVHATTDGAKGIR